MGTFTVRHIPIGHPGSCQARPIVAASTFPAAALPQTPVRLADRLSPRASQRMARTPPSALARDAHPHTSQRLRWRTPRCGRIHDGKHQIGAGALTGDGRTNVVVPARQVVARGLLVLGATLFVGDIFWCLLAQGAVSEAGYYIGMMLLSALGVVAVISGAGLVVYEDQQRLARLAQAEREELRIDFGMQLATHSQAIRAELRDSFGGIIKAIDRQTMADEADRERRLSTLEEQQETLAEMIAEGSAVTLDVPNGDVYELGKRVGREEAERSWRKDQTP